MARVRALAFGLAFSGGLVWAGPAAGRAATQEPKSNRMVREECPGGSATVGTSMGPSRCGSQAMA